MIDRQYLNTNDENKNDVNHYAKFLPPTWELETLTPKTNPQLDWKYLPLGAGLDFFFFFFNIKLSPKPEKSTLFFSESFRGFLFLFFYVEKKINV